MTIKQVFINLKEEILLQRLNPDYLPTINNIISINNNRYTIEQINVTPHYYNDEDNDYLETTYLVKPIET